MAENIKVIADRSEIVAIADAVRNKTGTTSEMTLSGIVNSVNSITTQPKIQSLSITSNGTYTAPSGIDGYSPVMVNVESSGSSLETSALSVFSAVGGTMYYIDENGQGRSCEPQYNLTCLKGSYFIIDHPYSADGFFCNGCEIVHIYGAVETTVEDGANNYVVILKATEDIVSVD